VGKIAKKQSEGVRFCFGTQNTVPYCQKHSYRLLFRRFCPLGTK